MRLDQNPEPIEDPDDDPPAVYYQQQVVRTRQLIDSQATPETDLPRLTGELLQWRQLLEAETRDEHWRAGDGDRPLF